MSETAQEVVPRWSSATIAKAKALVESGSGIRRDPNHELVFEVDGSGAGARTYRVQTDGKAWVSCGCPNGQRLGQARCYHSFSVLLFIAAEREEAERAQAASSTDASADA